MAKLFARGNDVNSLRTAVSQTPGDGVVTIEIDVNDAIPFFPDAHTFIVPALAGLDASINAIPGHHTVSPSTYTVRNGIGTLRVQVRTNPLPFLAVTLVAVVVAILGVAAMVGWRIYKADPAEFGMILLLLVGAVIAGVWFLRRYG